MRKRILSAGHDSCQRFGDKRLRVRVERIDARRLLFVPTKQTGDAQLWELLRVAGLTLVGVLFEPEREAATDEARVADVCAAKHRLEVVEEERVRQVLHVELQIQRGALFL